MRHTCRGTINLATANITVEDSCNFIISNGGAQTYHLKASSEVERQRWVTALELAKAKAVKMLAESGREQRTPRVGSFLFAPPRPYLILSLTLSQLSPIWLTQACHHRVAFLPEWWLSPVRSSALRGVWRCFCGRS